MKYTTDEALSEVMKRSKRVEIKRKRQISQIQSSAAVVLSLILLLVIAVLPSKSAVTVPGSVYGSFLLSQEAGGYVLVALIAFVIGILVTLICIRKNRERADEKSIDEAQN